MAGILHIETSTEVCSVAVSKDGFMVFEREDREHHADGLGTFIDEAMDAAKEKEIELDAVAVSSGPGSYTGLRIGVSMAKGICYGKDIKLISIPTLQLLCVPLLLSDKVRCVKCVDGVKENITAEMEDDALLCPMIDARRMEVYAAVYDRALKEVRGTQADIVTEETYKELLDKNIVYFFGNGAEKCMEVINHPNARFVLNIHPLAKNMMPLAEMRLRKGETEDVAYFVPQYFKDYVAKLPKKLI
ncbi:MAG: tRNA (adenosine(37)-N6)-threonylcarbamoyltransferase complex dimerization subunit type 1 TsaB [Prevotella sp.]|nr:tRNA (adenosine(37)-N6)-threonylcarbamoyltransferase complex dimerization subunit type 1 TsaB [Candidatus Prevotella equi]